MKQISRLFLICFTVFLLSSYCLTSARLLRPRQGKQLEKTVGMTDGDSSLKIKEDDLSNLMGLEECGSRDEECMKRRMVAEAHLDYIYTQHHNKPKGSP
ncbi:hypothetical protein NMG60_11008384 [Bertholletia excelsa]